MVAGSIDLKLPNNLYELSSLKRKDNGLAKRRMYIK